MNWKKSHLLHTKKVTGSNFCFFTNWETKSREGKCHAEPGIKRELAELCFTLCLLFPTDRKRKTTALICQTPVGGDPLGTIPAKSCIVTRMGEPCAPSSYPNAGQQQRPEELAPVVASRSFGVGLMSWGGKRPGPRCLPRTSGLFISGCSPRNTNPHHCHL